MRLSTHHRPRSLAKYLLFVLTVGLVAALTTFGLVGTAGADLPSDNRATFVDAANATTCADVGDSSANILFVNGANNGSDANISGTVTGGTTLNLTLLNPNVVVNAVVVKGGNGYNLYNGNFPNMVAPLTNGGQPAGISHWFVCYDIVTTPPPEEVPPAEVPPAEVTPTPPAAAPGAPAAAAVTARPVFTG
jgi:hypothetical protein